MVNKTSIKEIEEIDLDNPIILEGLPGIGFVGKIVVDQMIKALDATKFAELTSDYFPPQVTMKKDGLIEHMKNEFYYLKDVGQNNQDIVIITGNTQGADLDGQTAICKVLIEYFEELNAKQLFTLGGLGTGEMVENCQICVAGNNKELIDRILEIDNTLVRPDEGGAIIGASGLLLYYAQEKEIPAACLMGQTPGFYIDQAAAKEMLKVLFELFEFEFDLDELTKQAEDTLNKIARTQNIQQGLIEPQMPKKGEDLHYIG